MSNWISVKERLPEIDNEVGFEQVFVFCKIYGRYCATISYIDDTKWTQWKDWNGLIVLPPTHWMLLPEPPK